MESQNFNQNQPLVHKHQWQPIRSSRREPEQKYYFGRATPRSVEPLFDFDGDHDLDARPGDVESLEFVQHLVYRKPMEWWDVRDDSLAVLTAFVLYRLAGIGCTLFANMRCEEESEIVSPTEAGRL